MAAKTLNITNGDYFNRYFLSHFRGEAVPFCEAMMDGKTTAVIYSEEFIAVRSKELGVSAAEYRGKMRAYDALQKNEYTELSLWFGKDTFCQINLLALLAYLEQIEFGGKVVLNTIDDENFEVLEKGVAVELGIYQWLYQRILIQKIMPREFGVLDPKAIELYFDYHREDGFLANLVKRNFGMDQTSLICLLLENSKDYGLSDYQAEKLIEKIFSKGYDADEKKIR